MSDASSGGYAGLRKKRKPKPRRPPAPPPRSEAAASSGYQPNRAPSVPPRHTVFTDPLGNGPALHPQQQAQRQKVRDAQEHLPPVLRLPLRPKLAGGYTEKQRREIIASTSKAISAAVASGRLDDYLGESTIAEPFLDQVGHLTDRRTRTAIHKYVGALRTQRLHEDAALGADAIGNRLGPAWTMKDLAKIGARVRAEQLDKAIKQGAELKPGGTPTGLDAKLSGFIDDRIFNYAPNLRVLTTPVELTKAFVDDPVATTKNTVRTAVESIAGIPQGLYTLATDPGHALDAIGEDYKHRYGPLIEGNTAKFREQVQDESGLTPFVLDAGAAGVPVGRGLGAAARAGATGRAAEALAAAHEPILSRILKAAHETATRERPNLRYSGGEAGVVPQETSKNLFVAAGQRGLDTARKRAHVKRSERAGLRPTEDGRLERVPGTPAAAELPNKGRVPGLQPGANEVLPFYSPREIPGVKRLTGRVSTDIGGAKSKGRLKLLTRRATALHDIENQMKKLGPEERAALFPAVKYGLPAVRDTESRAQALAVIERRLAQLKRERKQAGFKGTAPILRETNDEVALLREIRKDPEKYLTAQVREAADEMRQIQRREEAVDPDLPAERATIRAATPQGKLLGVTRGPDVQYLRDRLDEIGLLEQARGRRMSPEQLQETHGRLAEMHPEERPAAATNLERQAKARLDATQRVLNKAQEDLANATGRAEVLSRNVAGTRAAETSAARGDRFAGGGLGVDQAREAVQAAKESRDAARDAYSAAREATRLVSRKDSMRLEAAHEFDARVRKAAEEAGLSEPGYWMSTPRPSDTYSEAAIGTGGRAVAASRRYTGALHDLGVETHTPDVLVKGVERNVKRRFSWALVNRNVEVHAFEWSRGSKGEGLTASEILREMDERHIDANSVAFINARIVRSREAEEAGLARGQVVDQAAAEDEVLTEVNRELAAERKELHDLKAEETQGQAMNRYLVVPKEVADELEHATRPDGVWGRGLEIILKQKPARILLGAFNVPWLTFQIASNALLTGLGGGLNPLDVFGAHKWWRGLTDAEKDAVEVELGITHGRHFAIDQTHLGSTKNNMFAPAAHLVDFWRAYKKSKVGRNVHKANPLDAMFKADEAQNNFFRKVLFYNKAKKTAYREMGASWRTMDGLQKKLMSTLGRPPEQLGGEIIKKGPVFEQHAKAVNEFLGNYLTFSNHERRLLSRNLMFYGYLRFSLRFAFWTMPVGHPVMTAILGDIGRMGAQEIKDLFGVPRNYQLPTSMLAKLYTGATPEQVKQYVQSDGKRGRLPGSVNIGRMNPGLNALSQMDGAQQAVGLVSPLYQLLVDQAFEESSFTGRDFRIKGQPTPAEAERPKNYFGSFWSTFVPGAPRNRIALADLLGLAFPYRLATHTGVPGVVDPMEGPQSDDSLLFDQRPMQYKDEKVKASIKASIQRDRQSGRERLLPQLLPFTPQEDLGPVVVARERQKEADAANRAMGKKKKPKAKKVTYDYGGGSSSRGSSYGGSSSTNYKSRYGG